MHDIQVVDETTLQVALSRLQSTDVITLSLDPSLIVAQEGSGMYTLDLIDSVFTTWSFNVQYLGDYNNSSSYDSDDIDILIENWGSENYNYELGPCLRGSCLSTDAPGLIPKFDEKWDIEDLMSLYIMWNASESVTARIISRSQLDNFGDPVHLQFEGNTLILELPEYEEIVQHIWFQLSIPISTLTFKQENFIEIFDIALGRQSEDMGTQEWDLANLNNDKIDKEIVLGTFETLMQEEQEIEFQYKLTSKHNIVSSGSMTADYSPVPEEFILYPIYPNPFNPVAEIQFALPKEMDIMIVVHDVQGRLVTTVADGVFPAGYHEQQWDGQNYSSGVYFLQMIAGSHLINQKLILLK